MAIYNLYGSGIIKVRLPASFHQGVCIGTTNMLVYWYNSMFVY